MQAGFPVYIIINNTITITIYAKNIFVLLFLAMLQKITDFLTNTQLVSGLARAVQTAPDDTISAGDTNIYKIFGIIYILCVFTTLADTSPRDIFFMSSPACT